MSKQHSIVTVTPGAGRPRRAFTIIEMLVVILILGILAGLIVGLAGRVTTGGKAGSTKNLIQTMDSIVTEYAAFKDSQVPGWVRTNLTQSNTDDCLLYTSDAADE